jgi:hypothetical protein
LKSMEHSLSKQPTKDTVLSQGEWSLTALCALSLNSANGRCSTSVKKVMGIHNSFDIPGAAQHYNLYMWTLLTESWESWTSG